MGLVDGLAKTVVWIAYLVLIPLHFGIGGLQTVDYIFTLLLLVTSLVQLGFGAAYTVNERRGVYVVKDEKESVESV